MPEPVCLKCAYVSVFRRVFRDRMLHHVENARVFFEIAVRLTVPGIA